MRLREETSKVVSVPPNEWLNTVSCALNFKVVSVSPENYLLLCEQLRSRLYFDTVYNKKLNRGVSGFGVKSRITVTVVKKSFMN